MTLGQKILIFIVRLPINILWGIDNFLIEPVLKFFRGVGIGTIGSLDIVFIGAIVYYIYSGTLYTISTGIIDSLNYFPVRGNLGDVLGAVTEEFPIKVTEIPIPQVTAEIILIADMETDKILFEQNADEIHAPASTTKLMTALVASELYSLDEIVKVSGECTLVDSTKAFLPEGSEFYVRDLYKALLIVSAGDAACTLSSAKIEYINFIDRMNSLAKDFGMENTHFTNPVGLDDPYDNHYSTAHDLYLLSKASMENKIVKDTVKTKNDTVYSVDGESSANLVSTNDLLFEIPNTVGIKTGTTEAAGEALIYNYVDDPQNVVIIILGSEERFSDTKKLLDWTLSSYSWEKVE